MVSYKQTEGVFSNVSWCGLYLSLVNMYSLDHHLALPFCNVDNRIFVFGASITASRKCAAEIYSREGSVSGHYGAKLHLLYIVLTYTYDIIVGIQVFNHFEYCIKPCAKKKKKKQLRCMRMTDLNGRISTSHSVQHFATIWAR